MSAVVAAEFKGQYKEVEATFSVNGLEMESSKVVFWNDTKMGSADASEMFGRYQHMVETLGGYPRRFTMTTKCGAWEFARSYSRDEELDGEGYYYTTVVNGATWTMRVWND